MRFELGRVPLAVICGPFSIKKILLAGPADGLLEPGIVVVPLVFVDWAPSPKPPGAGRINWKGSRPMDGRFSTSLDVRVPAMVGACVSISGTELPLTVTESVTRPTSNCTLSDRI